jgi:Na+-transporting NADH:ubiquinone oxidoreductase subunit C
MFLRHSSISTPFGASEGVIPVQEPSRSAPYSDRQVLFFIICLCLICALLLAVAAYTLEKPQMRAKEFDQSKQMLIAAKILDPGGYFQILDNEGVLTPAQFDKTEQILVPSENPTRATKEEISLISKLRIRPLLTDQQGNVFTLEEKNIDLPTYLAENKKSGYASLPLKLLYAILPNEKGAAEISSEKIAKDLKNVYGFVIPVSGFGLWAPIYGFIALAPNGNQVMGTTWYEHGETPGLGANITEPWWQKQFYGKHIFQESGSGKTDYKTADMGIIVVKGKVKDVYGTSPKSKSAVDGMSGATLTGDGVTQAYRNSFIPYRPFFLKLQESKNE